MSSVRGLKARPQKASVLPVRPCSPSEVGEDLGEEQVALALVGVVDRGWRRWVGVPGSPIMMQARVSLGKHEPP
jgi:hypothetical protein